MTFLCIWHEIPFSRQYKYITNHLHMSLTSYYIFVCTGILLQPFVSFAVVKASISSDTNVTYCDIWPKVLRCHGPMFMRSLHTVKQCHMRNTKCKTSCHCHLLAFRIEMLTHDEERAGIFSIPDEFAVQPLSKKHHLQNIKYNIIHKCLMEKYLS